jgi:hypothetical protein
MRGGRERERIRSSTELDFSVFSRLTPPLQPRLVSDRTAAVGCRRLDSGPVADHFLGESFEETQDLIAIDTTIEAGFCAVRRWDFEQLMFPQMAGTPLRYYIPALDDTCVLCIAFGVEIYDQITVVYVGRADVLQPTFDETSHEARTRESIVVLARKSDQSIR